MAWDKHTLFSIIGTPRTRVYKRRKRHQPDDSILLKQCLVLSCSVLLFALLVVGSLPVWRMSNNNDNHSDNNQEPRTCQELRQLLTTNSTIQDPFPIYRNAPSVVVFFHITKTGGTSIRSFGTKLLDAASSYVAAKPGDHTKADRIIQRYLQNKGIAPILFVEFHGQGLEVGRLAKDMVVWRQLQEQFRTNLFLFTVFRHPVDHAVSYYHALINHTDWNEESLDLSQVYSRQCALFVPPTTASSSRFKNRQQSMTPHACWEAYRSILYHMDWIGTTEHIDTETIPRLQAWIPHHGAVPNTTMSHKNVGSWRKSRLSMEASGHTLEQSILQLACEDHVLWEHFTSTATIPTT
eukprot:Nitzschia sp. Nitz4//scaffold382_size14485//1484//2536//NITZ4_008934-RA/size14485-processed-gene-0.6-mRNA-1//1//CDS//3329549911//6719//frame0